MDAKTYKLMLSPDLDISPEDFAASWNVTDQAQTCGQAQLSPLRGAQYDLSLAAGTLITIVTNLASSALYDYLKMLIQQLPTKSHVPQTHNSRRRLHVEELKKPDGTSLLIIDLEES